RARPPAVTWTAAMRRALADAAAARARGEAPVGAVVPGPAGEEPAAAGNARDATADPTPHAAVLALRAAARGRGTWRLDAGTPAGTLDPCTMCAGAAVLSRIDRIVYGATDDKGGAVGSLWDVVRDRRLNHRPEVVMGVLAEECGAV